MREATKEQFKDMYLRLGGGEYRGYGMAQWNAQFANDKPGMKYLVEEPATPRHTEMMIVTDNEAKEHRLFFMTEQGLDDHFDFPGKDS
jgi:hypothetical protein